MRRFVGAALIAGILSALALGPALATSHMPGGDACPHDGTMESLELCIQHMADQGFIDNSGVARSLEAKADSAQAAQDRDQQEVAIRSLEALIREAEAQSGKHINAMHAEHLIQHAEMVVDALSD